MHETPFYVTLPSDSSMEIYRGNSAADWTTKLKHPVSLRGKWEVALAEIQYVNSLSTLPKNQKMVVRIITEMSTDGKSNTFQTTDYDINFPSGHYSSAENFLQIIRNNIPELPHFITSSPMGKVEEQQKSRCKDNKSAFSVDIFSQTDHRLRFILGSERVHLHFPPDSLILQKILGFDSHYYNSSGADENNEDHAHRIVTTYLKNKMHIFDLPVIIAPRPLNPMLGNQSLYIYCDVADYSFMGDTSSQIIRTVPIKGAFMEIITERFDIPHYTPVLMTHFENINISISTDLEETAKFATGKSLVKLHFRPLRAY